MRTFNTSRSIAASPDEIFAAFTDPERLARWWGPSGFTNTFHTFEFQTGGHWVYTMHSPNGGNPDNESIFELIEPPGKIVIRHTSAPLYRLTINIVPADGGSRVTWAQTFDDPAVAERIAKIVVPANEQNLDRLVEELDRAPRIQKNAKIGGISPFFIVTDVPATLAFYRDKLGFDVTFEGPSPDDIFFGIVERGSAMIMFKEVGVKPLPNRTRDIKMGLARWDAYLYVPDPDALSSEFASNDVAFFTDLQNNEDDLRGFEIQDPDGYLLFFGRPLN